MQEIKVKYETEKNKVHTQINKLSVDYSTVVKKNNIYDQYTKIIKAAEAKMHEATQLEDQIKENMDKSGESQYNIKILSSKRRRIIPEDLIIINEEITKLEEMIDLLTQQKSGASINNSDILGKINSLKASFQHNHLNFIRNKLKHQEQRRTNIESILEKEKQIDTLLGFLFAELQNNHDPKVFQICMSDQELAIFMYYMGLTGLISSNKAFLNSLMNNLQPSLRLKVSRQIYNIFLDRESVEKVVLPDSTSEFDSEVQTNLIKHYSQLMKIELSKVFSKQLSQLRNPSYLQMVMDYMGIDGIDILSKIIDVGYENYFGQLAMALMAIIGLTTGISLLVSVVTVFLCWLSSKITNELLRICKSDREFNMYKASFQRNMDKVYNFLFSKKVYSTNYLNYIKEDADSKNIQLKDMLRYYDDTVSDNIFIILDSVYTGNDFFVSAIMEGSRVRVII
jgi:hypothetical protein